jgi:hypothetical protein
VFKKAEELGDEKTRSERVKEMVLAGNSRPSGDQRIISATICADNGISFSAFKNWVYRLRRESKQAGKTQPSFSP